MIAIPGYKTTGQIYESASTVVCRCRRISDDLPCVIKLLKDDYPSQEEITRYRREHEIIRTLEAVPGVIRVLDIARHRNTMYLVLEDSEAHSLHAPLPRQPMPLKQFLDLAIRICSILGDIHRHNVIHKNMDPANILWNRKNGDVKIIDFGISTLLSRENPVIKNPGSLEGSLPYISPEQTGRMNRSLDYRTDFYSLGVTFYELLTGQLPFDAMDAMELIHCHIAKLAKPPHQVLSTVPEILSDLVMKLMAKTAEERYQSAWGIQHDLELCLDQVRRQNAISPFPLANHDIPDQFHIPQKLYGREQETATLLDSFEQAAAGERQVMLVTGYTGIGKSALVQEIHKPVTRRRGYFISGKFDEFQRNTPYSALVLAFQELVRQLLTESEESLARWRRNLQEALGSNGRVIIEVIPEVELIVGPQPEVHELPSTEAQNRFHAVFEKFVRVFYSQDHPLAIFLDDLQWVDGATLKLLEIMMTDEQTSFLLLIGAYRDNEVGEDHPLLSSLAKMEESQIGLSSITLAPLALEHVCELIGDTLHSDQKTVRPLAELVLHKTNGNPFFVNQFLETLYLDDLITFDPGTEEKDGQLRTGSSTARWTWDLGRITKVEITDNVVDLLIAKMQRLPGSARQVLRLASCMGSRFDLESLAIITEAPPSETFRNLLPAVQDGFVLAASEMEFSRQGEKESDLMVHNYKFSHDRVRQAAYSLISDDLKQSVHRKIGKLLLANLSPEEKSERIFELADHLNLATNLLTEEEDLQQLCLLNQQACARAKNATAYGAALEYISQAMTHCRLLPSAERLKLLPLYKERAEIEYLNGNYELAESFAGQALGLAVTPLARAEVYDLLLVQYTMQGKHEEALTTGAKALQLLEITVPESDLGQAIHQELTSTMEKLKGREIASLLEAPQMEDADQKVAMRLLNDMTPAAYFFQPKLYAWVLTKMANISLEFGHVPESGKGYTSFGNVLVAELGAFRTAYDFGLLGLKLCEKINNLSYKCRSCFVITAFLSHWIKPIRLSAPLGEEGFQAGLESGELLYAGYIRAFNSTMNEFYRGANLERLDQDIQRNFLFVRKTDNRLAIDLMTAFRLAVLNLVGKTESRFNFRNQEIPDRDIPESHDPERSLTVVGAWHILKSQNYLLYDKPAEALQSAMAAEKHLSFLSGTLAVVEHTFTHGLALIGLLAGASREERQVCHDKLEAIGKQLDQWARTCPENFLHKHLLFKAELARTEGNGDQAMDLYDRAIEAAEKNQFNRDEAMANELAAKFWISRGKVRFAQLYLEKALYCYRLWGATRKADDLEENYRHLLPDRGRGKPLLGKGAITVSSSSTVKGSEILDLGAVIKASQAISGEIQLASLLKTMMAIVMEDAGAERGFLILPENGGYTIAAHSLPEEELLPPPLPLANCQRLSAAIVQYVVRTRDNVVLDDASAAGLFAQDDYVVSEKPRSLLCIPILRHAKMIAILYLENNQTTGAFTDDRLELLRIISAQAAISIENARYYTRVQESEKKFRSLYENAVEGIFQTSVDGRFLSANPSLARILGYDSPQDLIDSVTDSASQVYKDPAQRTLLLTTLRQHGTLTAFETQLRRKDGVTIWVSVSARAVKDSQGQLVSLEGSLMDITERKEKEQAQRDRKAAQAANRAKSEFLASMSHEIRTPMNAILGMADLLSESSLNKEQKQYVDIFRNAGESLLDLINDILDLSKVEAGQLDMEATDFTLDEVIEKICEVMALKAHEKMLELLYRIQTGIPMHLIGDPTRLRQILANLIGNAIKFTSQGEIVVDCRQIALEDDFVELRFSVRDTGIGIAADKQDAIFDSFTQADSSTTRQYGGTGLGLTICKRLVEMMEGRIWVESEAGQGSTFLFTARFRLQPSPKVREKSRRVDLKDLRVLVVDDNETNRFILREVIGSWGAIVHEADSGQSCLGLVDQAEATGNPYQLILLDCRMPEMDGFQTADAIKTRQGGLNCTMMMLTSDNRGSHISKAKEAGINAYLVKPIKQKELKEAIEYTLGKNRELLEQANSTAAEASLPDTDTENRPLNILLVEDNKNNRMLFTFYLKNTPHRIDVAENGKIGLEKYCCGEYDIVFMDMAMPVMDGYQSTREIRQWEKAQGRGTTPVIALTAHALKGKEEESLAAGCTAHMTKPFKKPQLLEALERYCGSTGHK